MFSIYEYVSIHGSVDVWDIENKNQIFFKAQLMIEEK